MELADLPQDIILVILSYLEAHDLLRCQLVSRKWGSALSDNSFLRTILKKYSHAREARRLLAENPDVLHYSSDPLSHKILTPVFRTIACRYHHLREGKIRRVSRYPLHALDQSNLWHPTPQWDYHESQPGGRLYHEAANHVMSANRKPYLFRQSLWSYDDGLVAFAPRSMPTVNTSRGSWAGDDPWSNLTENGKGSSRRKHYILAVLDLESDEIVAVPFDVTDRVVRNIRLKEGTLVVEWAEKDPFHDLNLVDKVHRHFATVYDVRRQLAAPLETGTGPKILVTFRSEFKIHFLGIPLTARDYFFSTHTRNHYALYLWQPNRSLWTGDEDQPIEALIVWNISSPSSYRPSEDPGNSSGHKPGHGPVMVGRFSFLLLEFLGIRQRANIAFISLALEEFEDGGGNIVWKENIHVSGQGYFDPAERNWMSRVTRFPFEGSGAAQIRIGMEELVAYRGAVSMESCELEDDEVEKWFLPVMDVVDRDACVRFALLETCFSGMGMINRIMVRVKIGETGAWQNMDGEVVDELSAMGRIAGDERWIIGMNRQLELVVGRFQ